MSTTPSQEASNTTAGSSSPEDAAAAAAPAPAPVVPPPPFSNNPAADLIIRSSDGVDFQVVKAILAAASPIFDDMFTVARPSVDASPTAEDADGPSALPSVEVTEDSVTLESLLRFCYPVRNPALGALSDVVQVLEAARKYEIEAAQAGCAERLTRLAAARPVKAYALACIFALEPVARAAAAHTLFLPLDAVLAADIPEAEQLSFACVQRLCAFRRAAQAELAPLLALQHWIVDARASATQPPAMPWVRTRADTPNPCCKEFTHERRGFWGTVEPVLVKTWWGDYMKEMAAALADVHNAGRSRAAEEDATNRAVTGAVLCTKCRPVAFKEFKIFERKLKDTLDTAVTKVAAKHTFVTKATPPKQPVNARASFTPADFF